MCYSARAKEEWRKLKREFGGSPNWRAISALFWKRVRESEKTIRIPKAMELQFEHPESPEEEDIKNAIVEYRVKRTHELNQEIEKQRERLAKAEIKLAVKFTKTASEEQRKATNKIAWCEKEIGHVNRTEPRDSDSRIYPHWYSFIVVQQSKWRSIVPAEYFCLPPGKPEFLAKKLPGIYNSRRDSLEDFWKDLFGKHHAIMQIREFWENVDKHRYENRQLNPGEEVENIVVHFNPQPTREMTIACLWSQNKDGFYSFSAIIDEPTPEIAAAGHDRCVVMLQPQDVASWLSPVGNSLADFYKMFDGRERPFFEHRLAA